MTVNSAFIYRVFNIIQLVLIDVKCPAESLKENELEEMRS